MTSAGSLNVVIAGASGAGKTTLVAKLAESDLVRNGFVGVARRLVTRPPRRGEGTTESDFVTRPELGWLMSTGAATFVWPRSMKDRTEWYGFRRTPETPVTLFPANDAIVPHIDRFDAHFAGSTLLVVVSCPQKERERRLRDRSPELWDDKAQIEHRLAPPTMPSHEHSAVILPSLDPWLPGAALGGIIRAWLDGASFETSLTAIVEQSGAVIARPLAKVESADH